MTDKELVAELEIRIKDYADAYYKGEEKISDAEYDRLIETLRKVKPDSELLGVAGSDIIGVSKKVKLPVTMGTLAKCNTPEDFKEWWNKHDTKNLVAEYKIDGNGQLLHYKNGKLIQVISRGDSEYGEDTTENMVKVTGVLKTIPFDFSGYIRGEVLMKRSTFLKYFPEGKNPRNMAAGIIKRLDGTDCDKLNFIAYDVFDDNNKVDLYETDKLAFLKESGFEVPEFIPYPTMDEIEEMKSKINPDNEIPCDGIVIKQLKVDKNDLMRKTPLNNVAYKPELQIQISTVKKIEWQLRGRYLAPIAVVEPVELEGTTVEKASLSNVNIMNKLGIYEGAQVVISKHGMIIPQVDRVLEPKVGNFEIPKICPVCGGEIKVNESGFPECLNEECPQKMAHQLAKMFRTFDIKYTGEAFIEALKADKTMSLRKFFKMCQSNDETILNVFAGGINGEKVKKQMTAIFSKPISVPKFLSIFDAEGLDEKTFEKLGKNKTLSELFSMTFNEMVSVDGIGEKTAKDIKNFFNKEINYICEISKFFTLTSYKEDEKNTNLKSICFTGACEGYSRKQLTEMAKGKFNVADGITKDLDILVCADKNSTSSKMEKARKNGTEIITYEEFLKMI